MKKNIVLFVLFVLPIVAYLFFASGVNSFTKLPILTPNVAELGSWKSLDGTPVHLKGKITILGFSGQNVLENRGNYFNLNAKIYQRYHKFKDLQFVVVCPTGKETDLKRIITALSASTDISQWKFVFTSPKEISRYFAQLNTDDRLKADFGTPNVYIIDKELNLRGRNDEKTGLKKGYNTFHPSELSNAMLDDFKIILYEYRAALKKNNNASKKL